MVAPPIFLLAVLAALANAAPVDVANEENIFKERQTANLPGGGSISHDGGGSFSGSLNGGSVGGQLSSGGISFQPANGGPAVSIPGSGSSKMARQNNGVPPGFAGGAGPQSPSATGLPPGEVNPFPTFTGGVGKLRARQTSEPDPLPTFTGGVGKLRARQTSEPDPLPTFTGGVGKLRVRQTSEPNPLPTFTGGVGKLMARQTSQLSPQASDPPSSFPGCQGGVGKRQNDFPGCQGGVGKMA
ncbi:hypothetical protein GQ53DRAFT_889727 [Thozetella sp. PMI_491]|nr:hypothetical protein GQ53DRAFT_889727 [Thozetella sp. PMI_491]